PIANSFSGLSEMSGLPEPAMPAGWGYSYLDWMGAYSFALAMLTALLHRERTGEGQWVDASQSEVGLMISATTIRDWPANGRIWSRYGNRSPYKKAAPHSAYPCAGEDRWLAIACFTEAEWRALAQVAGHPEWAKDARFEWLVLGRPCLLSPLPAAPLMMAAATARPAPPQGGGAADTFHRPLDQLLDVNV